MASPNDEGLAVYVPNLIPEPDPLFRELANGVVWDDRIRARRVASFGAPYNYSGTVWPESPMPELMQSVLVAVTASVGWKPNNCLANYYPDGDSTMGYHSDSVVELEAGTGIAIVSLGATRAISFRRESDRTEVHELSLASGSLLHMSAAMQAVWRHAILASPGMVGGRISLTFRRIRTGERAA